MRKVITFGITENIERTELFLLRSLPHKNLFNIDQKNATQTYTKNLPEIS